MILNYFFRAAVVFMVLAGICPSDIFAGESEECPSVVAARAGLKDARHTAFTRARAEMDIYSEASERCIGVRAEVGDRIGKNGVFATLNNRMLELEIKANQVMQDQVKNRMQFLEVQFKRYDTLLSQETTSKSIYDLQKKELDQARLELDALVLEREVLDERVKRHNILAPAGWTVTNRLIEPGEWVPAGSITGRVGDYSSLLTSFSLTLPEVAWLEKQGRIELYVPEYEMKIFARLYRVSPAFDPQTRKVGIDLVLEEKFPVQRGGVRVEMTIPIEDRAGAVTLPACALEERYEEHWLTREDGSPVQVMLLNRIPGRVTVIGSGIRKGDRFRTVNF